MVTTIDFSHPRKPSTSAKHYVFQVAFYTLFAVTIGYFSQHPVYRVVSENHGVIKLSMTLPGQLKEPCRDRSTEELAKLPPNMRTKKICGRERFPVTLELDIDGKAVYVHTSNPSGLSKDGMSTFYRRMEIPAGEHTVTVRMRDNDRAEGFNHIETRKITLERNHVLVIDYISDTKEFVFK
jgi:hypothetical protein